MNRFDLVIFDWDGTVMDTVDRIVHCWQGASQAMGLPVPAPSAIKGMIGLSMEACIEQVAPQLDNTQRTAFRDHYRAQYLDAEQTPSPLFEGIPELLETLAGRGQTLAVATGKARHGLERVLDSSQLRHFFSHTRSASDTASKPHPQMVLELCQEAGVSPQRSVVVGDAWFDMEMARRAGAERVGVSYGAGEVASLLKAEPLAIIDRPLALLDHL
ncbi:HAD family hydrolase [Ferrimonas marina]|uniref:Phosphoglycolate phosphatase n=1 Tax=Ferrimonas marina TaxID=299255 RepID=A0A1M5R906_9GAMM|nr:HAD-IA family hydrolase [Ferrimonas marina]SHH22516.1 phosphoglycolate phosphatase [Ferrimonas marina]